MSATNSHIIHCHECGLVHAAVPLPKAAKAKCGRCGALLYRASSDNIEIPLAFTMVGLVLFALANYFPMMTFAMEGREQTNNLISGVLEFWQIGLPGLAILVFLASIFLPFVSLSLMLYLLGAVRLGIKPPGAAEVLRTIFWLRPWAMMEVYMLGLIVAFVKLTDFADLSLDLGVYCFVALILVVSAANATLHADVLWARLGEGEAGDPAEDDQGDIASCPSCHLNLSHAYFHALDTRCPRCKAPLRHRKPNSLNRAWAYLVAAAVLYIPANVYPIMTVISFGQGSPDTILSGVIHLIEAEQYSIALIVFIASIFVPMLKIGIIAFLLISVQLGSSWRPRERTVAYRITEFIGRWSMIDIFMISILVALVKLDAVATIDPGPGAVAFAAVVILTMLSAMSFDPRLIWDKAEPSHG